eukprot:1868762-Karenia_brevis.AAC.1
MDESGEWTPMEMPEVPSSTIDYFANLIEQRDVKDLQTQANLLLPFKTPRPNIVVLFVGPFVLNS